MKLASISLIALVVQAALFSQPAPKLSLKLEGGLVKDSGVVQVAVVITNISQQAIDVFFTIDTFTNKFVVIGPDGKPAPPTKAPGQTGAFGGASLLSDLVDFSKPGTYRITATRHFAPPIDETDTSDVLEIKVP